MTQQTACEAGIFNEGTMTIRMTDPAFPETCRDTPCDASFSVTDHGLDIPTHNRDLWDPYLLLTNAGGERARLDFSLTRGWDVHWKPQQPLRIRRVIAAATCPGAAADQEMPNQSATEIRDQNGALLLLNAPDVPLAPGGTALLAPGFARELELSWIDLGCPAEQRAGVPAAGTRRPVAIQTKDLHGSGSALVTWGRSAPLTLTGQSYVVAVSQGWTPADARGCGRAALTIYRAGYLERSEQ